MFRPSKYERNRLVDSLVAPVVFALPKVVTAGLDRLAACFGGTFGNVLPGRTSREADVLPVKFGKRASEARLPRCCNASNDTYRTIREVVVSPLPPRHVWKRASWQVPSGSLASRLVHRIE